MSTSIESTAELLATSDEAIFSYGREAVEIFHNPVSGGRAARADSGPVHTEDQRFAARAKPGDTPPKDRKLEAIMGQLPDDLRALEFVILKRSVELRVYRNRVHDLDQHVDSLQATLVALNERFKAKICETEDLRKRYDEMAEQSGKRISELTNQLAVAAAASAIDRERNMDLEALVKEQVQRLAKAEDIEQELRSELAHHQASLEANESWRQIADEVIDDGEMRIAKCEERVKILEGELAIARGAKFTL